MINCLTPTKERVNFPTVKLLEDAKQMWNTKIVATQIGKTAHFPARHQKFMKQTFGHGFSKSLHHDFLTITYWNDNNAVCFMDNDMDSSRDTWETILVKNRNGGEIAVHIPKVASHYRFVYGWVDSCNQQTALPSGQTATLGATKWINKNSVLKLLELGMLNLRRTMVNQMYCTIL